MGGGKVLPLFPIFHTRRSFRDSDPVLPQLSSILKTFQMLQPSFQCLCSALEQARAGMRKAPATLSTRRVDGIG